MGKIIRVDPSQIRPSQDFLKKETLLFISEKYKNGDFNALPPIPIVREISEGTYISIDGHNLLAFYTLKNIECEVYVAYDRNDGIKGNSEMINKRNSDLVERFNNVISIALELETKGIRTILDLCRFTKTSL